MQPQPCTVDDQCFLLVIEDDSLIRRMFHIWEERTGQTKVVRLFFATSCQQALDVLTTTNFEMILLDLELPDSRGLQTLDRIIEFIKDRTPVIIISGNQPSNVTESEILQHGAQDIIIKPGPGIEELMRLVRYAASRHRIRVKYLDMIDTVQRQVVEARTELERLQRFCIECPITTAKSLECTEVSGPGLALDRLTRIIDRLSTLTVEPQCDGT